MPGMIRFKLYVFVFFLLGTDFGFAQNFTVKNYTVDEDLPFGSVKSAAQLENGYFYVASESQLARFDGISFHKIPILFHNSDDKIISIQASGKKLLVQGNSGFYLIDDENRQKFISIETGKNNNDLKSSHLAVNGNNEIFVLTDSLLFRFQDDRILSKRRHSFPRGITHFQMSDGVIFVVSNGTIYQSDTTTFLPKMLLPSSSVFVRYMAFDAKYNVIYFSDGKKLFQFFMHGNVLLNLKNAESVSGNINYLGLYKSNLHIATNSGFYCYNTEAGLLGEKVSVQTGLNSNNIYRSIQSKLEPVIFLISDAGLTKLSKSYFQDQLIFDVNSEASNIKTALRLNENQELLGTTTGLLIYSKTSKRITQKISSLVITKIVRWNQGILLFDDRMKSYILSNEFRIREFQSGFEEEVTSPIRYFSFSDGRLIIYSENKIVVYNPDKKIERKKLNFSISDIAEINGQIFLLSSDKIFRTELNGLLSNFDNKKMQTVYSGDNETSVMFADTSGILLGHANTFGLLTYSDWKFRKIEQPGLSGNIIKKIFRDSDGKIWFLTNSAMNFRMTKKFISYGKLQGIPSLNILADEINFVDRNTIELTTPKRLITFTPERDLHNSINHRVSIDRIFIYDRQLSKSDKIYISYDDNYLRFEFSVPTYAAPQLTKYSYRMLGMDTTWISSDRESSVNYTFLKPGSYQFQVKAIVWGSASETEITSQIIVITPPWWQTVWFKIILPIFLLTLIAYFIRYRLNHKQNQIDTLEEEVRKRTAELERLARIDGLTKLYNRRTFDELLDVEFERSVRFNHSLSLAFIDIDFFKKINDKYLHHIGDVVLAVLGEQMQNLVRSVDVVSRYGGEEFCIIFPYTDSGEAFEISERLRHTIQDYPWESVAPGLKVTISIGISSYPDQVKTKNKLLELADTNLYKAKENGRNQTIR